MSQPLHTQTMGMHHRPYLHREINPDFDFHQQEMGADGFATAATGQPFDYQILQDWANSENLPILVSSISVNMDSMGSILQETQVPVECTNLLLTIFRKVIGALSQQVTVNDVMRKVVNSNFFESQMIYFFDQLPHNKRLYCSSFEIMQNVFNIIDYILENLPEYTHKCYSYLCMIKEAGKMIHILEDGNILTVRIKRLMGKATLSQSVRRQRIRDIPKPDDAVAPDDFSFSRIFPDIEELEESFEPFLQANKTLGAYRDVQHYTGVHFRLLREDYLSPIRNGINDYRNAIQQSQPVKSTELRFYFQVQLVKMNTDDRDGITFIVKFDKKNLENIGWEINKRFLYGSLLCFSKDNFNSVIFATVADHNPDDHLQGLVKVSFQSNLEDVFTSFEGDVYVMAETVSFFESYRHVLEGLQEVQEIPLSDYILYCEKHIHPPRYFNHSTCFDFSPVMKRDIQRNVQLLSAADWPDPDETILNESQLTALQLALTKELVIIQGPPGTGKTYVGLKIMELLLTNREEVDSFSGPILVVCYTNHALDQFLEGILQFCKNGIVRVGGRSKSEVLKIFNLSELTKNKKISQILKRSIEKSLADCRRHSKKICRQIKALRGQSLEIDTTVLQIDDLREEMSEHHYLSLTDESRTDGISSKTMMLWMKAANANMEKYINEAAKKHLTNMIISGVEEGFTTDGILQEKSRMVRPDFETRIFIYRWWLQRLHVDIQSRLKMLFDNKGFDKDQKKMKLINELMALREDATKDILPDDVIMKYMTDHDVYECIKRCVESECGEQYQVSYIKSWLLGYFRNTNGILDAIKQLMRTKTPLTSQFKTTDGNRTLLARSDWVVEASDESDDDDSDMGFNLRDDEDDSTDDSSDEPSAATSEFRQIEGDFDYSEKKEILLRQRAKLLGIDLTEDMENSEKWQTVNTMTYSKVIRLIHQNEPFSEKEVSTIDNVWNLSLPERYRLYKYWMLKKKTKIVRKIVDLTQLYNDSLEKKKTCLARKKIAILKRAQVIGMTTTGAARHRKILRKVAPKTIVVEEAAEVLEAHIITTLNVRCKHLILIGDHQQLRPNPTVHRLAVDYKFEISLFERLVNNDLPMVTLEEQYRMRPEIANYVRLIYPNVCDHPSVCCYNNVSGVDSNVFFIHHEFEDRNILDSSSKVNVHEAEFLIGLCKYFLHHGYTGHQITILAAYGGQVSWLKECMQECKEFEDTFEHFRITSIDNYQGEENDIILLSLVRSNLIGEVGFLKIDNRVCVALSRARRGLFVTGNLKLLASRSRLWRRIVEMATRTKTIGKALKLKCINHRNQYTLVTTAKDFQKVPEGGCSLQCNATLTCGHICPRLCHADDRNHEIYICEQSCLNKCEKGHKCPRKCYEDCGLCKTLVEKKLPLCGHTDFVRCHEDENTAYCHQPCGQTLACGHVCKGFCGDPSHEPCDELVEREFPCSHINKVPCHCDIKWYPCPTRCSSLLNCKHRCKGTCGECLNGRVHRVCSHRCEKFLPCGHQCSGKCGAQCEPCPVRCPFLCRHGACSKLCGEPCDSCMENCAMGCKHQQCHLRCADKCIKEPCKRRCPHRTKCQHTCASYCGEECVCLQCESENFKLLDFSKQRPGKSIPLASKERALKFKPDKDTILMKIPRCEHIFTVTQLDKYVKDLDPDDSQYIRCPLCKNTIHGIIRYDDLNKSRLLRRENRKHEIIQSVSVSDTESANYQYTNSEDHQKCFNSNRIKAMQCHDLFLSVLKKIERMHDHFNWKIAFNKDKFTNFISSLQTRVTDQLIEELTLEFHRLLILEQVKALKRMISDAGGTLSEALKSQTKTKERFRRKLDAKGKKIAEHLVKALYQVISDINVDGSVEEEIKTLSKISLDIQDTLNQINITE